MLAEMLRGRGAARADAKAVNLRRIIYRTRIANGLAASSVSFCHACLALYSLRLSRAPTRPFRPSTPSCLTSRGSRTPMFSPTWIGPCPFTWLLQLDTTCCNAVRRGFALARVGSLPLRSPVYPFDVDAKGPHLTAVSHSRAWSCLFVCLPVPRWIDHGP